MCASTLLTLPSTEKQGKHSSITRLILWIKHCLPTSASPQKSSSTDQSGLWPSGLRVPGNVQIFRPLPIHWSLQSTSLVLEEVEMACLDCGLFLQSSKEEVKWSTTSWWPEKGEFRCMTSTCLHTTTACGPCTPRFPLSGLPKLVLSPSKILLTSKGWVKVCSKGSPLTLN